jgi:hypothetical protein
LNILSSRDLIGEWGKYWLNLMFRMGYWKHSILCGEEIFMAKNLLFGPSISLYFLQKDWTSRLSRIVFYESFKTQSNWLGESTKEVEITRV